MRMVIIGNGPAAAAAAETIRSHDTHCDITMISRENLHFYSPCPLAEYVEHSIPRERLFLRDRSFYSGLRIRTLLGRAAEWIDTEARRVLLRGHEPVSYERLLIATGASAVLPPIPGLAGTPGAFALKTLADAEAIMARVEPGLRAVVIGSGYIGLEAAQALVRRGLSVTVIEAKPQVLPQMLDEEVAFLVERRLRDHGIEVLLNSPAEAVLPGPDGVAAVGTGGREIPCELVICAAGVRPDLSLVAGSGIATRTGILVDDRMQTNRKDVFAAGDIVETCDVHGAIAFLPNWPNAVHSGRVAGSNMVGVEQRYRGSENVNVLRVFDVPVGSFGAHQGEHTVRRSARGTLKKLFLNGGRIVGGQMFGEVQSTGLYHELMKKGVDVSLHERELLSPHFGYGTLIHPQLARRAS